jgi:four helix bundle suffix protein
MKNPNHPYIPKIPNKGSRPGYEYLTCYMLGVVIHELTEEFCQKFLTSKHPNLPNPEFRQISQMTQAARSTHQNVAEGYTHESLKGYIYLTGIAHGSNEELTKDYLHFLKRNKFTVWPKTQTKVREFREFRVKWISPTSLNTPTLPNNPQEAANMLLTFCNMEGYLLKKLAESLKRKHKTEGGLTENLYKARKEYRGY